MAERFGGKYSPGGSRPPDAPAAEPFQGARRSGVGFRTSLLFVLPFAFVATAFFQPPAGLAVDLGAFALLMLAAWLTRDGVRAQEAYEARKVARRPAIPRKIFGSVLTGLGLFAGGYVAGASLVNPAILALVGAALHAFAFGPDPLADKGMEGVDLFQTDRVARAVAEGEAYLAAMQDAILRAGERSLETRVERFVATARAMFRRVESDPRDLTAARKYLTVYLMGARDATVKFADIYARSRDQKARADYEALLADLEGNFTSQTQSFLLEDRTDLTIEIDVLRERLQREGVKPSA